MAKFNFAKKSSANGDYSNKKANTKYVIVRLWDYIGKYKIALISVLIMTILSNILALLGPVLTGMAVNTMGLSMKSADFDALFKIGFTMAGVFILSGVLTWACQLLMVKTTQKTIYNLRCDMFTKITALPVSYFDKYKKGDIISKMTYDIDTLGASISSDIIQVLTSIISVIGSFAMMLVISPALLLIFAFLLPITIVFTKKITNLTRKLFRERQKSIGMLNSHTEEMLTGQKTIKAYNHEDESVEKFEEISELVSDTSYKAQFYSSMVVPTLNFVNNVSFLLVTVFGAILAAKGKMNLGGISSFILYSKKFSGPINEVANILSDIQSAFAAGERVFLMIDESGETVKDTAAKELGHINGEVVFEDVTFGYTPEKMVIRNFNLKVSVGENIAIVGQTGAGKTTVVNLLMRFYDVNSGAIFIDDTNICDIKRDSLRTALGMVLQDTWLFTGTIKENISYGSPNISDDDIINAAKNAMVHSFITKLPNGYDTIVDDNGLNISQGQRQLITIARAMLSNPKILILDEATSNVDTRTEIQIQKAMKKLMEGKTCFVIAHRLSSILEADKIIVMKDGELIEAGTHLELLDIKGYYYNLYNSQYLKTE